VSVLSSDGQARAVRFGDPTTTGGTPPVQISCQPVSDSIFKIGITEVRCTASDIKQVTDSCPFTVTVIAPPRLSVTKFIAFGDSMTAGEIVSENVAAGFRVLRIDIPKSYPSDLLMNLRARYTAQANDIIVSNFGKQGELAVDGVSRLSGALAGGSFQALLLMEGANDFPEISRPLAAIRQMVQNANGRGLRVFLATLPPENPFATCRPNHGGNWAFVAPYNDGLRSIAASQNAVLVDVYAAFNGDTTTLVDCDGLHPTAAGYQRIADTFFTSIRQAFELPVTPTMVSQIAPFAVAPRRR
jgi:lysophospholipase L1-like esterase